MLAIRGTEEKPAVGRKGLESSEKPGVRGRRLAWGAALCAILVAGSAAAESVTIEPSKDNTIYEEGDLSNGKGQYLFVGRTSSVGGNSRRRALLAFDVAGSVPAGATIDSTSLTLFVSKSAPGSASLQVSLYRLTRDWGEGASDAATVMPMEGRGAPAEASDATWTFAMFDTEQWSTPGGDFVADASATQTLMGAGFPPPAPYTWNSAAMTADVQAWLDSPESNFGWIMIGDESTETTARQLLSRDSNVASFHPMLTIEFSGGATPTPTPTPLVSSCVGDCNGDGEVAINELITGVNIALGGLPLDRCPSFDINDDGEIEINELITAVNNALAGCP